MKLVDALEYLNIIAFGGESAAMLRDYDLKIREDGYDSDIESIKIDFNAKTIFLVAGP